MSLSSLIFLSLFSLILSGEDCMDRSLYCTPVECDTRAVYAMEYCRRTCKVCNATRIDPNEDVKFVKKNETKKTNGTEESTFITPPLFGDIISDSVQSSQSHSSSLSSLHSTPDPISSSPSLSQPTQKRRTLTVGPFSPSQPQPFFPEPLAQPLRGSVDTYGDELEYHRRLPSQGYPYPSSSFPQSPSPPSHPPMSPSASSTQPRLSIERYRQQLSNQYSPKKNTVVSSRREERTEKRVSSPTLLPEMERTRQDSTWTNRVDSPWTETRVTPPMPIDEKTSALAIADLITLLGCRDRDPSTCSRITTDACLSRPGYYLKLCPVKCRNCSGLSCFDSVKVDCEEVLLLGGCRLPSAHEYCPRTCNLCPSTTQTPALTEPLICSDQLETCPHLSQAGVCNHPYSRTALHMYCPKSCGFCKEDDSSPLSSSYSDPVNVYPLPTFSQKKSSSDFWRRNSWK